MAKILIHGSGHKATSWNEMISHMENNSDILCPNLVSVLMRHFIGWYFSAELRLGLPGENENVDFDRHAI